MTDVYEDRAEQLLAFAEDRQDEPWVWTDPADEFGWSRSQFYRTVRTLRLRLADEGVNLVCEAQGPHDAWLYLLVSEREDAGWWARNRLGDSETRLATIESVAQTVVNVTDGRTTDGKKARLMQSTLHALVAQLSVLDGNV
jgi:hypothetical protein